MNISVAGLSLMVNSPDMAGVGGKDILKSTKCRKCRARDTSSYTANVMYKKSVACLGQPTSCNSER